MSQAIADQLFLSYMGRAADTQWRSNTTALVTAQGGNPSKALKDAFFTAGVSEGVYAANDSPSTLVNKFFLTTFGFAARTDEQTFWGNLLANGTYSSGELVWQMFSSYANNTTALPTTYVVPMQSKLVALAAYSNALTDPTINAAYSQLNSTSSAAGRTYLSGVTSQATAATAINNVAATVATVSVASGSSFTLTTNIDTFPGTAGNDLFTGTEANFGSLDTINGGAGNDTLLLQLTSATNTLSSTQISSIETLQISQSANASTNTNVGAITSATTLTNSASTLALVLTGIANAATAMVVQNTTQNTTFQFTEAAVAGTTDTANVTLSNVTAAAIVNIDSATGNTVGFETVALTSVGTVANSIDLRTTDTAGLATVTITGGAAITVALGTNITTTARTVNASTATGAVTITGFGAAVHTVTGGSGNDSFTFDANFIGAEAAAATRDTVNGGLGRDTLNITSARAVATSAVAQTTVSNIEILAISDASGGDVNLTNFTGADQLNFLNATVGAFTYTFNTASTASFITGAAGNSARSFVIGGTGASDVLNFTTVAGTDFGNAAQTFTGVETLNISTGTAAAGTVTFGGVVTMAPTAGGTGAIVVTGGNALTIAGVLTANSINGSAMTGVLTVGSATVFTGSATSITGGAGNDSLSGSTANDIISGGAGTDAIRGGQGNDILTGGAGVDTFAQTTAVNNGTDSITDFTAGTGGDVINISIAGTGAGQSQLRNGSGNASVAAGASTIVEVSAATTLVAQNVIILTGTFASAAAVQTAIEVGGTRALTLANANTAADDLLIVWSDGVLGHVSNVNIASAATTITAANATVTDHLTLTGITTIAAGQFVAANFAFIA